MSTWESYFAERQGYFWKRVEDEGQRIFALSSGETIAYESHFMEVLQRCNVNGLPPFGAALLIWMALEYDSRPKIDKATALAAYELTADIEHFLIRLSSLPGPFHQGERRLHVMRGLMEASHKRIGMKQGSEIIEDYLNVDVLMIRSTDEREDDLRSKSQDFDCLRRLSRRFSTIESLMNYLSRLPNVPDNFELKEVEDSKSEVDYLEELLTDHRTFQVASLVERMQRMVNFPKHAVTPGIQTVGGYADVTNKGDFDKLLISEFAYDDMSLMSRLANNESLYLRPDFPPEVTDKERFILLDTTIRNWGVTRVLGFALALAADRQQEASVHTRFYTLGDSYKEHNIHAKQALIDALAQVDIHLHAGGGLDRFFNQVKPPTGSDVILITNKECDHYPEWISALKHHGKNLTGVIQTSQDGEVLVKSIRKGRSKLTQRLTIPYEELWSKKKKPEAQEEFVPNEVDYPLLFMPDRIQTKAVIHKHYAYHLSKLGSLFKTFTPSVRMVDGRLSHLALRYGMQFVMSGLPEKRDDFEMGHNENGETIVLTLHKGMNKVLLTNVNAKTRKSVQFPHWKHDHKAAFTFRDGGFECITGKTLWKVLPDGTVDKYTSDSDQEVQTLPYDQRTPQSYMSVSGSVIKNLKQVRIDQDGRLCVNKHPLMLYSSGMVFRSDKSERDSLNNAGFVDRNLFRFSNGSEVRFNRDGMLILRCGSGKLPDIYLPSVINHRLGVATKEVFAGNAYYRDGPKMRIKLNQYDVGNRDIISQCIASFYGSAVWSEHQPLLPLLNETDADLLATRLRDLKCELEVTKDYEGLPQKVVTINAFYTSYLEPFIEHITKNET